MLGFFRSLVVVLLLFSGKSAAYIVNASEFAWLEQHSTVRVGVVANGLPWEREDPLSQVAGQQAQGYAVDLLAQIASNAHIQLQFSLYQNQQDAIQAVQTGQIDMLSSAPIHRRLSPFVHYSKASFSQPVGLYSSLDVPRVASLDELGTQVVAVVNGSSSHELVLSHYPQLKPVLFTDTAAAVAGLQNQQVAYLLAGSDSVTASLRALPAVRLQHHLTIAESADHRFAVRDDWPQLLSIINRGINAQTEEQLTQRYQIWLQQLLAKPEQEHGHWWMIIVSIVCVLAIVTTWSTYQALRLNRKRSKSLQRQLEHLQRHDEGTGLPNRRHFETLVDGWLDQARPVSIFMFDFQRQAEVFENFGYKIGRVTKEAYARRVQKRLLRRQPEAHMGHWYHNIFVIAVPDVHSRPDALELAQLISQTCRGWLRLEHLHLMTSCHVGYCTTNPKQELCDANNLFANTFVALNHAIKQQQPISVYQPEQSQAGLVKLTLESKLRRAIKNNELELYFQPQFSLTGQKIIGAEVLVRWFTADGPISPATFVPVAEDTGLVLQLDRWVYERSMQWMARVGHRLPSDFKLSVNFSASTVALGHAEKIAISYAKQWQIDPRRVCIEITESAMMERPDDAKQSIQRLRNEGFGVAIDDFGTGYSSMAYLKHLPVSLLKIDRAFVKGMEENLSDQHIVRAMVTIAKSMNYEVLIEGIETASQASLAQALGCESAQGYHYSHPLPEHEFIQRYMEIPSSSRLKLVAG